MGVRTALPGVLGLIISVAFNHKSAQRSFAGCVYCIAEPSGTSFEGLWMNSCREGHPGVTERGQVLIPTWGLHLLLGLSHPQPHHLQNGMFIASSKFLCV